MTDPIAAITSQPTTGPFDTAAMQIAMAQAQAAAAHTNQLAFLKEIAKSNDETNAHALDGTPATAPTEALFGSGLLNLPASEDPNIDPSADPTTLSLFTQFGADMTSATSDSVKAHQLHDMAVLQKDTELLEQAAYDKNHIPMNNNASTVDLSLQAQSIAQGGTTSINGSAAANSAQLAQLAAIVQPIANDQLTEALLQHIQAQLIAQQNPIQLNLNTLTLAMNFIASLQPSTYHTIENVVTQTDNKIVAPITPIAAIGVENMAIL
ncbi:MAG: hypothetical protein EBR02_00150 [Alphaproteobacteria bacterium]|nr:hypothetical protein [Alphaproteobacteria bacterium]